MLKPLIMSVSYLYFSLARYSACGFGGFLLLGGLVVLSWIEQDDGRHSFGHAGGTQVVNSITPCSYW